MNTSGSVKDGQSLEILEAERDSLKKIVASYPAGYDCDTIERKISELGVEIEVRRALLSPQLSMISDAASTSVNAERNQQPFGNAQIEEARKRLFQGRS